MARSPFHESDPVVLPVVEPLGGWLSIIIAVLLPFGLVLGTLYLLPFARMNAGLAEQVALGAGLLGALLGGAFRGWRCLAGPLRRGALVGALGMLPVVLILGKEVLVLVPLPMVPARLVVATALPLAGAILGMLGAAAARPR